MKKKLLLQQIKKLQSEKQIKVIKGNLTSTHKINNASARQQANSIGKRLDIRNRESLQRILNKI